MTTPANKQLEQSQVGNSTRNFYFYGSAIILIVEEEKSQRKRYYYIYLVGTYYLQEGALLATSITSFCQGQAQGPTRSSS